MDHFKSYILTIMSTKSAGLDAGEVTNPAEVPALFVTSQTAHFLKAKEQAKDVKNGLCSFLGGTVK